MAQIRIDLAETIRNGMDIKFQAPCDCSAITGLMICYPVEDGTIESKEFSFRDAHGNDLAGLGDLFSRDSYVKVIVDTNGGYAYIQNADTNAYLESRFAEKNNLINIGTYVGDIDSLDIPLNSVAWIEKDTCINAPTSTAFYLETLGSHDNVRIQRVISTEGTSCQRMYFNGAWTEWDWFNPWQANGSESRTAERWNGHVIYTRNVACGALTSGRKLIELPELANCVVLDAFGYVNQGGNNFTMIPSIYSMDLSSSTSVSILVNTTTSFGAIQIWGGSALVGKTAFVQLKYFKL